MSNLRVCESCNRHIVDTEAACPFCDVPVTRPSCEGSCAQRERGRLSRAALLAAGATFLGAACSSSYPPYGTPPKMDAGEKAKSFDNVTDVSGTDGQGVVAEVEDAGTKAGKD
jgi:hypothetical protein